MPILRSLRSAAKSGNASAQFILGRLYDEGWGVTRDGVLAMRWYMQAARRGFRESYYYVGSGYSLGDGVKKNAKEAERWFHLGAQTGDLDAAYMEALKVLEVSKTQGNRLMLNVARRGSHDAMDYLADQNLKTGRLVEAKKWAKMAVAHGDQMARLRLREIVNQIRAKRGS
jgi:TPR repeat protein